MQRLVSVFCVLLCCWLVSADLTLEILDANTANQAGARCLDGSPGSFHFEQGVETKKWVIYMQGGGSCDTQKSCTSRSKTDLGSSTLQETTIEVNHVASSDPIINPGFWNWTHVHMDYCSGDRWTGTRVNASADSWGLYFAGHVIFQTILERLITKYQLDQATEIFFYGTSAGALGVVSNIDYMNQRLPGPRISVSISAGWGVDFYPAWTGDGVDGETNAAKNLYQAHVNQDCAAANANNITSCFFPRYIFPFIPNRVFILNSLIDLVQMATLGFPDEAILAPNGGDYLIALGNYTKLSILTEFTRDPRVDGLFITSCPAHVIAFAIKDTLPNIAMSNWYYRPKSSPTPAITYDNCALDSVISLLKSNTSLANDCPRVMQLCKKNGNTSNVFEAAFASAAAAESEEPVAGPSTDVPSMPMSDDVASTAQTISYLNVITVIMLAAASL